MSQSRLPAIRSTRRLVGVISTCAVALLPLTATAQEPTEAPGGGATDDGSMGRIVAVLVDGVTGAPIPDALVMLEALSRRTLSDSVGTAIFLDVPPGAYTLGIRHIAYGEQSAIVDVEGMSSAIIALQLDPRAIAVAPLDVLIEQRPRYLENEGFYDRRAVGMGTFFDPLFVERWGSSLTSATRFVDLLIDMSPQMGSMTRTTASSGNAGIASIGDGFTGGCPVVWIDGQRTFNDPGLAGRSSSVLDMLSTYTIGAVEVYASSHGIPFFALDPQQGIGCGSIVIWTNRWRGRTREIAGAEVERCEPENMQFTQVEGEIRDEYTGVLLPGAHVIATSFAAGEGDDAKPADIIADQYGRYRICDIPPDHQLSLRVEAADRTGPELQIDLAGPVVTRDLSLRVAGPGKVVGRVLDRSTGRPVATASVGVVGVTRRTQTDSEGYFVMEDVLPGDQVLEIEHLGFAP
ncbi:MAG: carboxypeptidase regulatory-like domain-containing protein, partial [Gemmatimonadota bacterium]